MKNKNLILVISIVIIFLGLLIVYTNSTEVNRNIDSYYSLSFAESCVTSGECRNISYANGSPFWKMDLFLPKNKTGPHPVIIFLTGGSWSYTLKDGCSAGINGYPLKNLLDEGYAIACTSYTPSNVLPFPQQIYDAKAAVRFLRANSINYNLDPNKIGTWGQSAGGHEAALLATTNGVSLMDGTLGNYTSTSSKIQAAVILVGPTFLLPISLASDGSQTAALYKYLGGNPSKDELALARGVAADVKQYVTNDDAPILLQYGSKDTLVPPVHGQVLDEKYKSIGLDSTFKIYSGGVTGHGDFDHYPDVISFLKRVMPVDGSQSNTNTPTQISFNNEIVSNTPNNKGVFSFGSKFIGNIIDTSYWDYSVTAFKDDDGSYNLFWCSDPTSYSNTHLDSIRYAWSTKPDSIFTSPVEIGSGCAPTVIKVPSTTNNRCGQNSVYLMYYETAEKESLQKGNKIGLRYSCSRTGPWTTLGEVIEISGNCSGTYQDGTCYGTGHPNAIFKDGKIYITYYESSNGLDGPNSGVYLAESFNGEQFTKKGRVGDFAGTEIKYIKNSDLFIGNISAGKENIFISKTLNSLPNPVTNKSIDFGNNCTQGTAILTNSRGIIDTNKTYMYTGTYSGCSTQDPNNGISQSKIGVSEFHFKNLELTQNDCIGTFSNTLFLGKSNSLGFTNQPGDDRFFCYEGKFYECGWDNSAISLAIKSQNNDVVGEYTCNLNNSTWEKTTKATCTENDWIHTEGSCQSNGEKIITHDLINNCENGVQYENTTIENCEIIDITCEESDYTCGDWSTCSTTGNQTRTCTKINTECGGGYAPSQIQNCYYVPPQCTINDWTYNDSECNGNGELTRTWKKLTNCKWGVTKPETEIIKCNINAESCVESDFIYSNWSPSICPQNEIQTRNFTKINECNGNPSQDLNRNCDFVPICTQSFWDFNLGECINGVQDKNWFKINNCDGGVQYPQTEKVICEKINSEIINCSENDWAKRIEPENCPQNGVQTIYWDKINSNCSGGVIKKPIETINCITDNEEINNINNSLNENNNKKLCSIEDYDYEIFPNNCPAKKQQLVYWIKNSDCEGGLIKPESEIIECEPEVRDNIIQAIIKNLLRFFGLLKIF